MRVVVAGATGVIGRFLVPALSAAGHEVTGLSRAEGVDLLDRDAVIGVFAEAEPGAVVHMATAIPARINPKAMAHDMELTNRLRTDGTRHPVEAAQAAGVKKIIVQGLAYAYQPGEGLADEDAPRAAGEPAATSLRQRRRTRPPSGSAAARYAASARRLLAAPPV